MSKWCLYNEAEHHCQNLVVLLYILIRLDDNIDVTSIRTDPYSFRILFDIRDLKNFYDYTPIDNGHFAIYVREDCSVEITETGYFTKPGYYNDIHTTTDNNDIALFPNLLAFFDGFVGLNLGAIIDEL